MINPTQLRSLSYWEIGTEIQREVGAIISRWEQRVKSEHPSANRVHHAALLNHLPAFLSDLGRTLAESSDGDPFRHCRTASVHGDQRWEVGWSIAEVVRDYQILRLVLVEFLGERFQRSLDGTEVMALGLAIDDAIAASVTAYMSCVQDVAAQSANLSEADRGRVVSSELLEIFGILGHELRNSLSPIVNALHVLQMAADRPTLEKTRSLMERQVSTMTRLIEDLLDVPRLARGKISLQLERIDLSRWVHDAVEDRRGEFERAGIRLTVDVPPQPLWTSADLTRLNQILGNLLSNSLKFVNRGGEVLVELRPAVDRGAVTIRVRDTGIGIPTELLPRIFDPFHQADRSVERTKGGLGLGLALVKGLVELHGGRVRAFSDGPDSGSEFVVELPLLDHPRSPSQSGPAVLSSTSQGRCVLVIDDNRELAETTRMLLEMAGHHVHVAFSGGEGLKAAQVHRPDVIFCDISMTEMSGYDVCEALMQDPQLRSSWKVALSGHASQDSRKRAMAAGFDFYLLKPVDPQDVSQLVANCTPK